MVLGTLDLDVHNKIAGDETECESLLLDRLALKLDAQSSTPLYRQLSQQLQDFIRTMKLMPGELLPSTRELASALKISRKTVCRCYEELLCQGFIQSESGVGTFVSSGILSGGSATEELDCKAVERKLTNYAHSLLNRSMEPTNQGDHPELHFGAPPVSELPLSAWRQVLLKQLRNTEFSQFYYDTEPFGYLPLRTALCSYLLRSRALKCEPEQLILFSHALSPLRLFAKIVVEQGDTVVVENPGFPFAREVFAASGATVIPVNVDDEGLRVQELEAIRESVKLVYVTPSHQDPTGAMMTLSRRTELLHWARTNNCLILEDDYDCELRYTGSQLPALMALDHSENVVYLGDMWKTMFPLVNIGYLVIPKGLIDVFTKVQSLSWAKFSTSLPFFDQLAVTEFLEEGFFERHVRKTRSTYAGRYRNLIVGLTRYFSGRIEYAKESASMQLLVRFDATLSDLKISETARAAGLAVVSTRSYYCDCSVQNEFLIAFVMHDEAEMMGRLKNWASLLFG